MVHTLSNSIRTVFWMMIFSLGLLYFGALLCVVLLGNDESSNSDNREELKRYFGSVSVSLFTHIMIASGEGWNPVSATMMREDGVWALYIVCIVSFMNFAMQNVMRAIITYKVVSQARDEREMFLFLSIESEEFCEAMRFLFDSGDFEKPDSRTRDELFWIFNQEDNMELLDLCKVSRRMPFDEILPLFDPGQTDEITFYDLVRGCLRLRALRTSWFNFLVHCDIASQIGTLQRGLRQLVTCALSHPDRTPPFDPSDTPAPAPPGAAPPRSAPGADALAGRVVEELLRIVALGETTAQDVLRAAVSASFTPPRGVSSQACLGHALDCGLLTAEEALNSLFDALDETVGIHVTKQHAWFPRTR